jgi:3-phenylpropionate/trans-cinnamate dioxygenase ferredoxin reductase component
VAVREIDYLLVGGGIASAYCASELRKRNAEGSILLVGREPEPPYDRPPLSKEYLRGEASREDALVNPREWYADNEVELLTGSSVIALDPDARMAKLQGGEEVAFDKALLATGAMVNILRVDGAQLEGIHYLRAFGNSDSIRGDVEGAEHVVCVGGSFIGAEVAASLTAVGKRCTIVELEPVLFSRVFGEEAGRHLQDVLTTNGVRCVTGEGLAAFEGDERVTTVLTESGTAIECDAVVVGAGVRPDTMLAGRAGLEVDDGIVCDSGLETSVPGIFAAGDCCNYESELHGGRVRFEHWDVALHQGQHAARSMLGDKTAYRVVPYFFSDLADWAALEYVGGAGEWDEVLWRGGPGGDELSAWYVANDRLVGALAVGLPEHVAAARRLIDRGAQLGDSRAVIADPDADLEDLG